MVLRCNESRMVTCFLFPLKQRPTSSIFREDVYFCLNELPSGLYVQGNILLSSGTNCMVKFHSMQKINKVNNMRQFAPLIVDAPLHINGQSVKQSVQWYLTFAISSAYTVIISSMWLCNHMFPWSDLKSGMSRHFFLYYCYCLAHILHLMSKVFFVLGS